MTHTRIATNIADQYALAWGPEKAIAEFIQNALDERDDAGATCSIEYRDGVIVIEDNGRGLSRRHLALGITEKTELSRGQHAEGMKIAMMVLLRNGRTVTVKTGNDVIVPAMADTGLGVRCMVFDITESEAYVKGTHIEIDGSEDELETAKAHFTEWLPQQMIDEEQGLSLPGGSIFVNGVRAGTVQGLFFSYHLTGKDAQAMANRDRDNVDMDLFRQMLRARMSKCNEAAATMLLPEIAKGECFETTVSVYQVSPAFTFAALKVFGDNVLVLKPGDNAERAEYNGYKPITVGWGWAGALASMTHSVEEVMAKRSETVRREIKKNDRKRAVVNVCIKRLEKAGFTDVPLVKISKELLTSAGSPAEGLWDGSVIWLSQDVCDRRRVCLSVLVHELAHCYSGAPDCSAAFESELSRIWGEVAFA